MGGTACLGPFQGSEVEHISSRAHVYTSLVPELSFVLPLHHRSLQCLVHPLLGAQSLAVKMGMQLCKAHVSSCSATGLACGI